MKRISENGDFLGLNNDSENSSDPESDVESGMLVGTRNSENRKVDIFNNFHEDVIFEENLLDGLSSWLDKLFEGTTTRYHINYWPEHMK